MAYRQDQRNILQTSTMDHQVFLAGFRKFLSCQFSMENSIDNFDFLKDFRLVFFDFNVPIPIRSEHPAPNCPLFLVTLLQWLFVSCDETFPNRLQDYQLSLHFVIRYLPEVIPELSFLLCDDGLRLLHFAQPLHRLLNIFNLNAAFYLSVMLLHFYVNFRNKVSEQQMPLCERRAQLTHQTLS